MLIPAHKDEFAGNYFCCSFFAKETAQSVWFVIRHHGPKCLNCSQEIFASPAVIDLTAGPLPGLGCCTPRAPADILPSFEMTLLTLSATGTYKPASVSSRHS